MKLAVFTLSLAFLLPAWGGLILCPAGHCVLTGLDEAGLRLAYGLAQPGLDMFMQGITWLGSVWVLVPLAGGLALALWRGGRRVEAVFLVAALLGAIALAHGIKPWIDRPRPDLFPMLIPTPADAAYPSAHTLQAVAMALALAVLAGKRKAWSWPLLALAALLVGWSRIHLQVHFPTDVLAGALAAILWVTGLYCLLLKPVRKEG